MLAGQRAIGSIANRFLGIPGRRRLLVWGRLKVGQPHSFPETSGERPASYWPSENECICGRRVRERTGLTHVIETLAAVKSYGVERALRPTAGLHLQHLPWIHDASGVQGALDVAHEFDGLAVFDFDLPDAV